MNCASRDEAQIAFMNRYFLQMLIESSCFYSHSQLFFGNLVSKTVDETCTFFRIDDVPHLRFSVLMLVFSCICIIRMYLDRQIFLCIYKLHQNRQLTIFYFCPKILRMELQYISKRLSFELAAWYNARTIRMDGAFPRFRKRCEINFFTILIPETCSAPEIILPYWGKP